MDYFVRPETRTLTLTSGATVTVRRRLNAGEERRMFARMYIAGADGRLKVDPLQTGIATMCAFLLDWTVPGLDGAPVPIAGLSAEDLEPILDNLQSDIYGEIRVAIELHQTREEQARQEEKKLPASETASSSSSRSAA
jgi:hypothetical protein